MHLPPPPSRPRGPALSVADGKNEIFNVIIVGGRSKGKKIIKAKEYSYISGRHVVGIEFKEDKEYCQCSVRQTAVSAEEDRHANINLVIPKQDAY